MVPDPLQLAELRAERQHEALALPGGLLRCYQCDDPFDPESEGGLISPDPYAMPVCGKCLECAYDEHQLTKINEPKRKYRRVQKTNT